MDLSITESAAILLSSFLCIAVCLLIRLKLAGMQKMALIPHLLSAALFLFLLYIFSYQSSHFALALLLAGLYSFAFYSLLIGRHPIKVKLWKERDTPEKIGIILITFFQLIFLPLFVIWLWYFTLFPSANDKEHFSAIMFYVGTPMTVVGMVFFVIYSIIAYFAFRKPEGAE